MMDNGQLARWVVQSEHIARNESQKRNDAFLRDIQSDDFNVRSTQTASPKPVQTRGITSFIKQQLAAFSSRLAPKPVSELDCTEAGYEKNCV